MTKKLLLSLLVVGLLGLAVGTASATPIDLTGASNQFVGDWSPGSPNSPSLDADYLAYLIQLATGTTNQHDSTTAQTYDRSNNFPNAGDLPSVFSAGLRTNLPSGTTGKQTFSLTGAAYIIAKYDGPNDRTLVWYLNGAGTFTIPGTDNGYGISDYTIFYTTAPIPEPTTLALLGTGLAALGAALRRRKKQTTV